MYFIDYHNHTQMSFDATYPLTQMARSMAEAGIREMCVTDHCDLVDEHARRVYSFDWDAALAQYDQALADLGDRLVIKQGLEFGMGHLDPPCSETILNQPRLDFVIGSVHNYSPRKGCGDFYLSDMSTPEACAEILEDYFYSLDTLCRTPYYDILGHVIYPLRYMNGNATIHPWMDQVSEILRVVIESGRGIEVNTYCGRTVEDWIPVLRRYQELGGEILTVGSDAHHPENAGRGIPQAYDLLRSLGFRWICTYEKRKPTFMEL